MAVPMRLGRLKLVTGESWRGLLVGKICNVRLRCMLLGLGSHSGLNLLQAHDLATGRMLDRLSCRSRCR
jgi:hypothetical protein